MGLSGDLRLLTPFLVSVPPPHTVSFAGFRRLSGHNRDTVGEVSRKRSESLLDYDPPHRLTTERHRPLPRLIRLYLEFLKLLHRAQEPIVGLASSAKAIAR